MRIIFSLPLFAALACLPFPCAAAEIFPIPQQMEASSGDFKLDSSVTIALPRNASPNDEFLARSLTAELADWYRLAVRTERMQAIPGRSRVIVMGTFANPLVKQMCTTNRLQVGGNDPGAEGYVLQTGPNAVLIAGSDERGAFYGLQSLRQIIERTGSGLDIAGVNVRDWPYKPIRGIKLYLPGHENIPFFKRFVSDFAALYKYNYLFVEFNGGMRLDRHPEINAGWQELFKNLSYSRRDRSTGPHGEYQDSPNQDVADGGVLEKAEVADLVAWTRQHHIEFVPEIPSLTHSYYLLTRHRELADVPDAEWPDAYCPSNPDSYKLLFDVLDECIDLVHPRMVHIGHDEWRSPLGACPRCAGKDRGELFAQDVNRIHDYLAKRNIRVAMYGDHLMESVRGREKSDEKTRAGYSYEWPGALTPEQVKARIPKDILIFNWFWREGKKGEGEPNDIQVQAWGFEQVFNNFVPGILNYGRRSARKGVAGGVPSSWAATTEFNFGKDLIYDFLGCANLVWSKHWPEEKELSVLVQRRMPQVRRYLQGMAPPSQDGDPVVPVDISSAFNGSLRTLNIGGIGTGTAALGNLRFNMQVSSAGNRNDAVMVGTGSDRKPGLAGQATVPIRADASSLILLHASATPARNAFAYSYIYNFDDTADLLGHYEVVYEDGLVESIPIRYGVNILEWNRAANPDPRVYCYGADAIEFGVENGQPTTMFALEWRNPRFGKVIKEVRVVGSSGFKDTRGRVIPENIIILKGVSIVKRRQSVALDR